MRPRNQPEILLRRADRSDLGALLSLIHRFAAESGEPGGGEPGRTRLIACEASGLSRFG